MLVQKSVIDMGLADCKGEGTDTKSTAWSVCLKFSHRQLFLNVLHVEATCLELI